MHLEIGERDEETAIASAAKPGQFVQIRVREGTDPLLRRPFTFYKARKRFMEILYKLKGEGTRALSRYNKGERVDVVGPLGNGFTLVPDVDEHVLVAGGSGIASMYLLSRICGRSPAKTVLLLGAQNKDDVPMKKTVAQDFEGLAVPIQVWTNDGSLGNTGFVTKALEKILQDAAKMRFAVYASGPIGMLRKVSELTAPFGIPTQISLEQHIACGMGVCEGCVVKTRSDSGSGSVYRKVCSDGPVFDPTIFEGYWDEIVTP